MIDISPIQILMVLAIALLVFGPSRLPEMGRTIGRGLREFRSSVGSVTDELTGSPSPRPHPAAARPDRAPAADAAEPSAADAAELDAPADEGFAPESGGIEALVDEVIVPGDRPPDRG